MENKIDSAFAVFKAETGLTNKDFIQYLCQKVLDSIEITPITKDLNSFLALTTYAQIEVLKENKPTGLDKTYWYNQIYTLFIWLSATFADYKEDSLFISVFRTSLHSLTPHLLPF